MEKRTACQEFARILHGSVLFFRLCYCARHYYFPGNVLIFNSPCFVVSCSFQIRVVNAFRQGLDARYGEHSNTSLAEVLRKQTSLSKRLSQTSSIEYADNIPDELTIPEIDVERLSSHSHTETAVQLPNLRAPVLSTQTNYSPHLSNTSVLLLLQLLIVPIRLARWGVQRGSKIARLPHHHYHPRKRIVCSLIYLLLIYI